MNTEKRGSTVEKMGVSLTQKDCMVILQVNIKTTTKFGYIWHTTGSGKTLTSFKTAQILTHLPNVHKVVFVVDRKDLDYQTTKEFNSFSKGSVDGTNNTNTLANQLSDDTKSIILNFLTLYYVLSNIQ